MIAIESSDHLTELVCEAHWLLGWVEWIAIHQNDDRALKIADQMLSQFGLIDRRRKSWRS
jgi:hypothetical protein